MNFGCTANSNEYTTIFNQTSIFITVKNDAKTATKTVQKTKKNQETKQIKTQIQS